MVVAVRAALLISGDEVQMHYALLTRMIDVTQVAHQAFSLLTNMLATSIIAFKAWCVCVNGVFGEHFQ
jgi:tryptophan 2,3-dioxygenase